eukprot:NODE_2458_length_921_cov_117.852064_g2021_i0.p1 GENE.NODE_2458_length_921_cov_117.852064_g2021_i0~~NODE_2458_length_921_cov_117.852064_g2021_i0.p1  ORF type:complete len:285 (+),score=52.72 NODE_2458_length_921_cov_117.852064_g2021_i0:40-894(+)
MQSKAVQALLVRNQLVQAQTRMFRRNAAPGYYNMRFRPSQGIDNQYVHYAANIHPADGEEIHKTKRDPSKHVWSSNIFRNDFQEWRFRGADYLYQIYSRLHRSNDGWTRSMFAWTAFSFIMFNQALIWKIHFAFFTTVMATRIRDKGAEPTIDEIAVLDTIFKNEKISSLFSPESYHVIDFDQEWDSGRDNPMFPEYRTPTAKFFNVDTNTTTGRYVVGDLESGATMTLHFKTMPYSNNKYNFTEPYLVYDMWAEINHDGQYHVEHLVKAEDTLKTKEVFVVWH